MNEIRVVSGEIVEGVDETDWYAALVEECQAIVVEAEFQSRWVLVEGYHTLGARILRDYGNFERANIYGGKIVQRVAQSLQMDVRTVYYAMQFARKFPNLERFPAGKNVSWRNVVRDFLPAPQAAEVPFAISGPATAAPNENGDGGVLEPEWNDEPLPMRAVTIVCRHCGVTDSYEVCG